MGRDKALIPVGGAPLAARPGMALAALVDEVILAGRPVAGVAGRAVADASGVSGPLAGALAALHEARGELVALVACDVPELAPALVELLRDALRAHPRAMVAVGRSGHGAEPLPAVVRRDALEALERAAARGVSALGEAWESAGRVEVDEVSCRSVDPELRSFASWNTPEQVGSWPLPGEEPALRPPSGGDSAIVTMSSD